MAVGDEGGGVVVGCGGGGGFGGLLEKGRETTSVLVGGTA